MHITILGNTFIFTVISYTAECLHVQLWLSAIIIQDSWACGTWRHAASCLCSPWMHTSSVWGCFVDARFPSCSASATAPPSSASGQHPGLSAQRLKSLKMETCLESPAAVRKRRRTRRAHSAPSILLVMWRTDIRECGVCYMTEQKLTKSLSWQMECHDTSLKKYYIECCADKHHYTEPMHFYLHYISPNHFAGHAVGNYLFLYVLKIHYKLLFKQTEMF